MASEDSTQATGCRGGAATGVARKALRMIALESWGGADCHGGGGGLTLLCIYHPLLSFYLYSCGD